MNALTSVVVTEQVPINTTLSLSACMYPLHACLRRWVYEHATGAREHMRSRRYHGVHARLLPPQHPPNIPCLFADLVFFRGVRSAERPALRRSCSARAPVPDEKVGRDARQCAHPADCFFNISQKNIHVEIMEHRATAVIYLYFFVYKITQINNKEDKFL